MMTREKYRWCVGLVVLVTMAGELAYGQRNLKDIPVPDAELERRSFILPEGFEVNLYAADPQIAKPIQMNFDAQGRLWIASSSVYPHIKPGQTAADKVLVVEDRDGDGRAERTTVFADGLLIPTGVVPGDGGAYVVNSTELVHLQDSDNDGKADRRRVVLSGFGSEDTHHLLHTLRWGHDGALYMNQSIYIHSHVETPYGVRRLGGGGIWRFHPGTLQLDVVCRGFVNPWGHHFDHWGQSFATDGAYGEGINYVFPGSVFVTAPGAKRFVKGLNPGSPKHCGLEIVSGGHLPAAWQGSMITNDFRAHRVCRFVVTEDGAGYASRQETELIRSKHVAFRPIDVKMGPDGAIYIADWYNPIIQHGEVDFRDERRDHVHGRIWRVTAKGRPLVQRPEIAKATNAALFSLLGSQEEWIRLHAKLALKARDPAQVRRDLGQWLNQLDRADDAWWHHRLEALWVMQCINVMDVNYLAELVAAPDHRVRAASMRVVSQWFDDARQGVSADSEGVSLDALQSMLESGVADSHPRVRLEAVRGWARVGTPSAARHALAALEHPMDRFLDFALWQTMRDLHAQWLPALVAGDLRLEENVAGWVFAMRAVESTEAIPLLMKVVQERSLERQQMDDALSAIASLGGPREISQLLGMAADAGATLPLARRVELLRSLISASRVRKIKPQGDLSEVRSLLQAEDPALRAIGAEASGLWKVASQYRVLARMVRDADEQLSVRLAAIGALASYGTPESRQSVVSLAEDALSVRERMAAVNGLCRVAPARGAQVAVELLEEQPEGMVVAEVVRELGNRKEGDQLLAKALVGHALDPDVAKLLVRAVRARGRAAEPLLKQVRVSGKLADGGWKLDGELMEALLASVRDEGDAGRGEAVYRRKQLQCTKCHAIGGAGGKVGPDLVSLGGSAQPDYLVEALLLPNKKVKENFHALQILTDEGRVVSGIPVRQNKTEVVLRTAEDKLVSVPVASIDESREGRSLMPDGTVDGLTRAELVDLVRFLSELGKVGEFSVGTEQVARRWRTLVVNNETSVRLRRTSFDTAATSDPALVWEPAYSTVAGNLPIDALPQFVLRQRVNPTSFVRAELVVTTPGAVGVACNAIQGLQVWLDGRPQKLLAANRWDLSRGTHVLTFAIDHSKRRLPLRLQLQPADPGGAQVRWVTGK